MIERAFIRLILVAIIVSFTAGQLNTPTRTTNIRNVNRNQMNQGIIAAINSIRTENNFISSLSLNDIRVTVGSSSFAHFQFFQSSTNATALGEQGLQIIAASKQIKEQEKLSVPEAIDTLPTLSVSDTQLSSTCPARPVCRQTKYRSADGSCNNLNEPLWGKSLTPMQRIVLPDYADGIFDPRVAADGSKLPSARLVSASLVPDLNRPRGDLALMIMTFSQFVDHDFNLAPPFTTSDGSGIECCTTSGDFKPASETHPRCFPIEIPANDPFYGPLNRRCMNFVRTMPGPRSDCTLGYADQLEELTHWQDASQIYGSDDATANRLRSFKNGKLLTGTVGGRDSLPLNPNPPKDCASPCFMAGDVRVAENQLLTEMHTLWMREHNRVASELLIFNPTWNDETLYQEARRIVVAQFQHIVYNEFLPIVLGPAYVKVYNLLTSGRTFSKDYVEGINPSINSEFATAAFRMGHSLLQGVVTLLGDSRSADETPTLSSIIQNSQPYTRAGFLDRVTRSLLSQPIQSFDNLVTEEVTKRLFRGTMPFGMDLVALNVQRGRDHGLPGYNSYREICGLPKAKTFEDLAPVISPQTIAAYKKVYKSVDDIDLFIGGLNEEPIPGALVGRTFVCIIGDQFTRLKKGDRYFYDLGSQPHSFQPAQLEQIRKASLARIICDNSDGTVQFVQSSALKIVSKLNPAVPCDNPTIPRLDFSVWAGEPIA